MEPALSFLPRPALPREVVDQVFSYLSRRDLVSVSLLNRAWQALAFPHLYHTLHLGYADHLKQVANRAASDDGHGPLSISAHVKGLVLRDSYGNYELKHIIKDDLDHLKKLIPRLGQLRQMSWELYILSDDTEIMPMFQTWCPNLKSFHVTINQDNFFYHTELYTTLFNFKGLTNISLKVVDYREHLPLHLKCILIDMYLAVILDDETCLEPLTTMLTSSPDLVSLAFELSRPPVMRMSEPTTTFSPNLLISSLGDQFRFRHLRTLHMRGRLNPDWDEFAEDVQSNTHPLRVFLACHPTIEDLALGWFRNDGEYLDIGPEDIASLLPSLKHFEGPAFLCGSIVKSNLAKQLESLIMVDQILYRYGHPGAYSDTMTRASDGILNLPKLRRLAIWSTTPIYGWVLERFTKVSSKLRELEFRMKVCDCEDIVDIVSKARYLRKLVVSSDLIHSAQFYPDGDSEEEYFTDDDRGPEEFIKSLARVSKRLTTIGVHDGWWGGNGWRIKRKGGKVKVIDVP